MKRLAIFIALSGQGGVERMVAQLAAEIGALGVQTDLLIVRRRGVDLPAATHGVELIDLGVAHTALALLPLARYLRKRRPQALLAAKDRAGRVALLARALARVDLPIAIRLGTNLSAALQGRAPVTRWLRMAPMRLLYPHAEAVIAVSEGVAEDTARTSGLERKRIHVVRNPVITAAMYQQARLPLAHPWLSAPTEPVSPPLILGVGRLTEQKDFPTLLRAFARLRQHRPARLILLGEGRQRHRLEQLARDLAIADSVQLPGFDPNPYAWMARASLFVLSSRWEGSPNVLTEAMALGTPVVATDCPSGPNEILQGGEIAPLIAVGDDQALATAMAEVLDHPPPPERLQSAVSEYAAHTSALGYLRVLDIAPTPPPPIA